MMYVMLTSNSTENLSDIQDTGPHLFEFTPSGNCHEYYAMSIGARSQSAKTYLEKHYEEFEDCDLDALIKHGLNALRDTLQQDKELTSLNTSIVSLHRSGKHMASLIALHTGSGWTAHRCQGTR